MIKALPSPFRPEAAQIRFNGQDFPQTLAGFVWRVSAWDQVWLCVLSVAISILDTAPLEVQRRIIDKTVYSGDFNAILLLAAVYTAIVLAEGIIKLVMNVYRGWVGENAVRILRGSITLSTEGGPEVHRTSDELGTEAAMIVAEVEPVGGFAGDSLSEPLLQGGTLLSVFGYLAWLNPFMALVSLLAFSPQFVFVPLIQKAINESVRQRIAVMRVASAKVIDFQAEAAQISQEARFQEVFTLNMWIYKLKYSLNFLMNLTLNLGTIGVLALGGYYVVKGSADVGTVVAFVTGLRSVSSPWGSLVNWVQNAWVTSAKYDLLQETVRRTA